MCVMGGMDAALTGFASVCVSLFSKKPPEAPGLISGGTEQAFVYLTGVCVFNESFVTADLLRPSADILWWQASIMQMTSIINY